jgi:hypothetical protein
MQQSRSNRVKSMSSSLFAVDALVNVETDHEPLEGS